MGCCGSSIAVTAQYGNKQLKLKETSTDLSTFHTHIINELPELTCQAFYLETNESSPIKIIDDQDYKRVLRTKPNSKLRIVKAKPYSFSSEILNKLSKSVFKIRQKEHELVGTGFLISPRLAITTTEPFPDRNSLKLYSALFQDIDNTEIDFKTDGAFLTIPEEEGIKFSLIELNPQAHQLDFLNSLTPIKLQPDFNASEGTKATIMYYTRNYPVLQGDSAEINVFDHKFFSYTKALKEGSSGAPVFNEKGELIGVFSSYKSDNLPGSALSVKFIVDFLGSYYNNPEDQIISQAIQEIWRYSDLASIVDLNKPANIDGENNMKFSETTCYLNLSKQFLIIFGPESYQAKIVEDLPPLGSGSSAIATLAGILITGTNGTDSFRETWLFDGTAFIKEKDMINEHIYHCSVVFNEKVYVISGRLNNKVEAYDLKSNDWIKIAKLPKKREMASATVISDQIFVFGGINEKMNFSKKIFSWNGSEWKTLEHKMPIKACGIGVINISQSQVLLFGGSCQEKEKEKNDNTSAWEMDILSGNIDNSRGIPRALNFSSYQAAYTAKDAVIFSNSGELLRYGYKKKRFFDVRPEPS